MLSFLSIRWRLTLFHALVILVIGVFLIGVLLIVAIRAVQTSVEESVERRASQITRLLETEVLPDDPALRGYVDQGYLLLVRDGSGNVLAEIDEEPARYDMLNDGQREALWREVIATGEIAVDRPRELYGYGVPVDTTLSDARVIEIWRSYDQAAEDVVPFLPIVTLTIPALLVLAIAGSWLMARSSMAPVSAIVRAARRIREDDLSQRLPVQRPRDELGQLATTFNELLARLDVAFHQREEALRQQQRFVADASHELRTPLTSIEGYARMLRQWGLDDPDAAREGAVAIEREATRMRELIDELLDLAHGDEAATLVRAPHDLRPVVTSSVDAARIAADGRAGVIFDRPPQPVIASVDGDRIRQVIDILLDNAVKYTREGGTVRVSFKSVEDLVVLTVEDNGLGIDRQHLPHIFERFYRVDAARTAGGNGLGLAIARQIVEQHGGMISAASELGVGSIFTVTLPVDDPNNA